MKLKLTVTDAEVYEKEVELKELTVVDFSRSGYSLVQAICRILKNEDILIGRDNEKVRE